jgi:hypothetical protein
MSSTQRQGLLWKVKLKKPTDLVTVISFKACGFDNVLYFFQVAFIRCNFITLRHAAL